MDSSGSQRDLKAMAERIAVAARATRAWVGEARESAPPIAAEADSLILEARRAESLARKLGRAATRRMCVGVYGASQQGKSYLVSVLARPPGKSLLVRFGDETCDFVSEINPQGGKESTGLVTRFGLSPGEGPFDAAYPVELQLLTELDLVKILANSFQSDFDQNNAQLTRPNVDAVRKVIGVAEANRRPQTVATHLDDVELTDLSEYFAKTFHNRWEELNPVRYWERIVDLAPALPLEGRAQLYSVLWGGLDEFTALFRLLAGALESLGNAGEAITGIVALVPRASSIIDVATLLDRLGTARDQQDRIRLRARRDGKLGPVVELPRAVLTALVAELRITMNEQPWPFLEHTDLLDFPGARSRLKLTGLPSEPAERELVVRQLLLRGKVAYLFQRYSEERELTSMLLCMGNKPNEVKDLPAMVRQWIELSHGATAAARRNVPEALFLVLTMMDLEFAPKAGDDAAAIATKWDVRLHTSLQEPFANDEWVRNFAGAPFDNTLLLRNPNFRQDQLVEYQLAPGTDEPAQPLVEVALSRRNRSYIDRLQDAFLASKEVAKHVRDTRRAWEAIFTLNDGGVSYIVERLAAVSDPSLKSDQIGLRLREGARALHDRLKRFYHGLDAEARREKEAALRELRTVLQKAMQPRGFRPFGRLVGALSVGDREIREIALNVAAMRVDEAAVAASPPEAVDDIFGAPAEAVAVVAPQQRNDRAALFATELHRRWIDQLRRLSTDEPLLQHFRLTGPQLDELASQLIIAADRLALVDRMAEGVRAATNLAGARWEDLADRVVTVAGPILSSFVSELGEHARPLGERPGVPENSPQPVRRVFEPPPFVSPGQLPVLGAEPEAVERRYFVDWGVALLKLGIDNIGHSKGRALSDVLNTALGRILDQLSPDRPPT